MQTVASPITTLVLQPGIRTHSDLLGLSKSFVFPKTVYFFKHQVESELENLRERIRTLEAANASLRRSDQIHATELATLQHVATQLITVHGLEALYDQILDTALTILDADLASIQMVHEESGTNGKLKLLGHRGFSPEAAKRWEWVGPDSRTTCGEALRTGRKVIVPDVESCDFMAGSEDLAAFLNAGIRSAQTLPLVSRSGELLGMVTTYWRRPHELSVTEMRGLDILARLASDVIDHSRVREALWEEQQHLISIYETVRDVIFYLAVEPEKQFRFVSVNAAFLRVTGLCQEQVAGKTVNEVIPEPSLTIVLEKYRRAIEKKTIVLWEETSDYPTGRLTGEVSVVPVFDDQGTCTHLVGSVHDITDRKRVQEDLRALTARLVELQELGMKQLARELHDDLSQNLAALGMEIERLLPPSAQPSRSLSEQAHEVWRKVTKMARDVHSMSERLHPAILDELGLKEALKEQCWAFSERTGIPVHFEPAGELPWPGADVSLCFYRLAQEGLHNIAKHAGATSVHLTLSSSEQACTMRIEDNGRGFDPSEANGKNALGLISMRERARLVNGNFTIKSECGKGTILEVSVALTAN